MFSLSDRARRKMTAKMTQLDGGESRIVDCLSGRAQFRWTTGAIAAIAIASVAAVLIIVLTGAIPIPGALLVLYVVNSVRPPRVIAVTDRDVFVATRSFLTGKASQIVAREPHAEVTHRVSERMLIVGSEQITFNSKEHERLSRLLQPARV